VVDGRGGDAIAFRVVRQSLHDQRVNPLAEAHDFGCLLAARRQVDVVVDVERRLVGEILIVVALIHLLDVVQWPAWGGGRRGGGGGRGGRRRPLHQRHQRALHVERVALHFQEGGQILRRLEHTRPQVLQPQTKADRELSNHSELFLSRLCIHLFIKK
jgi:hypothetical protein